MYFLIPRSVNAVMFCCDNRDIFVADFSLCYIMFFPIILDHSGSQSQDRICVQSVTNGLL